MQSISNALNALHADVSWFVRAAEVRMLVVRASSDLRSTVVPLLPKYEFDRDNRSPWVLFEDACTATDRGWLARTARLQEDWELRRQLFRDREQIEMPAAVERIEAASVAAGAGPLARFASTLAGVLDAQRAPLDGGCVLVLAPGVVEDVDALGLDLLTLMTSPALDRARWILLLDEDHALPSVVERLGPRALVSACVVDPDLQRQDFAALTAGSLLGRAGPRGIAPPRRVDAPPAAPPGAREAMLRAAGIDPAYVDQAPALARLVFDAAIAMKDGRGHDAIAAQTQARDVADQLAMHDVTAFCSIALASYLSGLDRRQDAVSELRRAIQHTARHQLGVVEAQARLALGLLLAVDGRYPDASREYAECARCAEAAAAPLIAIEGWRLAGQIALQLGDDEQTRYCFREAIRVAHGSDTDIARTSSAPEAARALARHYQAKGFSTPAESLFQHAEALEQGMVGVSKAEASPDGALCHAGE